MLAKGEGDALWIPKIILGNSPLSSLLPSACLDLSLMYQIVLPGEEAFPWSDSLFLHQSFPNSAPD